MATWVTHLMIADKVLKRIPHLLKHEFCVGNIAPDCNIENEDWTSFTPSRETTHWMSKKTKSLADGERFLNGFLKTRTVLSAQEESFLLGYYSHLISDALFREFIRDEERVKKSWMRIMSVPELNNQITDIERSWDSIKILIPPKERMADIHSIERKYLDTHPDSGYLTEILPLESFPDYIDYLPSGSIVRKIKIMGYIPQKTAGKYPYITISEEEYLSFIERSANTITNAITLYKN